MVIVVQSIKYNFNISKYYSYKGFRPSILLRIVLIVSSQERMCPNNKEPGIFTYCFVWEVLNVCVKPVSAILVKPSSVPVWFCHQLSRGSDDVSCTGYLEGPR